MKQINMPTPEEIKKLSREYADDMRPVKDYESSDDFSRCNDLDLHKEDFCNVIKWLSERFCIIPKSKVKGYYEDVCEDIRDYDGKGKFGLSCADMTMYQRARGMKQMLYRLFGKDTFEEEGK